MSRTKAGFIIKEIHRQAWESLPNDKAGELIKTLIKYQFDDEMPDVKNISADLRVALNFLLPVVDKQKIEYEETCKKRSEAAKKRWNNED